MKVTAREEGRFSNDPQEAAKREFSNRARLQCPQEFPFMRLRLALVLLWTLSSLILFFVIAVLIFRQPNFPLNLGLIRTTGRTGLWATLLPSLWGLAAVCLLFVRRKLGAQLLGIYSAFWLVVMLSGLPLIWNARHSFCFRNFCITTPWVGRLTVIALSVPFLLVTLWSRHEVVCRGSLKPCSENGREQQTPKHARNRHRQNPTQAKGKHATITV